MKIKIKTTPDDFTVHELADLPLLERGTHGVYLLSKKGFNTAELLSILAKKINKKSSQLAYGGRKDRHANTHQFVTIEGQRISDIKEENYSLSFKGFMDRPMGPDLIIGNDFQITVRQLDQNVIKKAIAELSLVETFGYPNYFDDQRFGSYHKELGFIAEKILIGHYNGALKIYLTLASESALNEEKNRKKYFLENWTNWSACLEKAATDFEKDAFAAFQKKPIDYLSLIRKIPKSELSLYFSAYQSFLWNEIIRRYLVEKKLNVRTYPGKVSEYLFYDRLDSISLKYFENLQIPTAASNVKITDVSVLKIFNQILHEREVRLAMFNLKKIRHAFFKSTARHFLIKPQNLSYKVESDQSDHSKNILILKFFLTRGSYATMLLKRIFADA